MPWFQGSEAYNMWAELSTKFAKTATGDVHVFLNNPSPASIWLNHELPALLENPNITNIIYH
jgi:hypothetical protein